MLTAIAKRVSRALGLACLHVLLFAVLHGVATHVLSGEVGKLADSIIEIASEALVYEF